MKPQAHAAWRLTVLALALLPAYGGPGHAANATASASARVTEAVALAPLLGAPVSINDLLAALRAPAGPRTGSVLLHLPDLGAGLALGLGAIAPAVVPGMREAIAGALTLPLSGTLQGELVAAVSLAGQPADSDGQASITVAFN